MARQGDDDFDWIDSDSSDFEDSFEPVDEGARSRDGDEGNQRGATNTAASGQVQLYTCGVCNKVYKNDGRLRRHKAKGHDVLVPRLPSKFRKEDALAEGPGLVRQALEQATEYTPFALTFGSMVTPGNKAATTATELLEVWDTSDHAQFTAALSTLLWTVVMTDLAVGWTPKEAMFRAYHKMCATNSYHSLWEGFMSGHGKVPCPILHQFVTWRVFWGLAEKKESIDAPTSSPDSNNP